MSILENLSDLAHELRCAAGTVLTILGSRLEAQERARVECGPQWLTEFEEQRDSLEPGWRTTESGEKVFDARDDNAVALLKIDPDAFFRITKLGMPKSVRDHAIVRALAQAEARAQASAASAWYSDEGFYPDPDSSAAVSAAADPSPIIANTVPRVVGGEGPGPDSVIPQTVGPGRSTDPGAVSTPAPGGEPPTCVEIVKQLANWTVDQGVPEWAQMLKVSEEAGEAAQAYLRHIKQPSKVPDPWSGQDVVYELADTAIAALVAIQRINHWDAEVVLTARLDILRQRYLTEGA